MTIFPLWVWAALIGLVLGMIGPKVGAEPKGLVATFDAPHTNGQLFSSPCENAAVMEGLSLAGASPELLAQIKAATGTYEGKPYGVCWAWNLGKGNAVIIWDDGSHIVIPKALLKFATGV